VRAQLSTPLPPTASLSTLPRSEARLQSAEEAHSARVAALTAELKELKAERESQKDLYYNTISAVNEQVGLAVGCGLGLG